MRLVVIEVHPTTAKLFRFTCSCGQAGAWLTSINDAERSGGQHNREQHRTQVSA